MRRTKIDQNNQISHELSEKIQDSFIDIMKDDFKSIPNIYFIPTKSLDREMSNVKRSLLRKIRSNLKTNIITIATPQKLENIIKSVSKNRLSDGQIDLITDSLVISISKMTKDIAIVVVPFSQTQHEAGNIRDYWRFTPTCLRKLFRVNNMDVIFEAINYHNNAGIYLFFVGSKNSKKWIGKMPNYNSLNSVGQNLGLIKKILKRNN